MHQRRCSKMLEEIRRIFKKEETFPLDKRHLYHKNCGQTLIEACVKKYNIDIDEKVYKCYIPYGFGCGVGKGCGAFHGCIGAIGLLFTEDSPSENLLVKEVTKEWALMFCEEFGSLDCDYIRPRHKDEILGCRVVMERSGVLFEKLMDKYLDK